MFQPKNKIPSILVRQSFENQQQLIPQEQQQQQQLQPQELFKTATFFEPPTSQQQQSQHQQLQSHKQLPQRSTNLSQVLHLNLPHSQEIETRQILSSRAPTQQNPGLLSQHRPSFPNKSSYNSPTNLSKITSIANQAAPTQPNPSFTQAPHQLNSLSVRKRPVLPFKINQPTQHQQGNEGNSGDIEFWSKVKTIISDPEEIIDSKIRGFQNIHDITLPSISSSNNSSSSNIYKKNKSFSNQIDNLHNNQGNSQILNNKKIITQISDGEKNQNGQNSSTQQIPDHYPKIKMAQSIDLNQSSCSTRDSLRQHSSPQQNVYQSIKQDNQVLNPLLLPQTPIKNDLPEAVNQASLMSPSSRRKSQFSGSSTSSLAATFGPRNAPLTNSSKKFLPYSVGTQSIKSIGHIDTSLSQYSEQHFQQIQPYFSVNSNNLKGSSLSLKRALASSQENPILHTKISSRLQEECQDQDKDANSINYSNYFNCGGSLSRREERGSTLKNSIDASEIFSQQGAPRVIKRTSFLSNEFLKSPSNDNSSLKSKPVSKRAILSKISKVTSAPASNTDLYGNHLHTAPDAIRGYNEYNDYNDIPSINNEFSFCYDKNQTNSNNSNSISASKIISSSSYSCREQLKKISLLSKQQDNLVKKLFRIDDDGQSGTRKNSNYLQLTNSQQNLMNFNKFKSIHVGSSSNNCN